MATWSVCATLESTEPGAELGLTTCEDTELQSFVFSGEGTITAASAPEMCLTAGEDTRSGRSDANQIKTLTLETCSDDLAAYPKVRREINIPVMGSERLNTKSQFRQLLDLDGVDIAQPDLMYAGGITTTPAP